jgi:hypothetical protein
VRAIERLRAVVEMGSRIGEWLPSLRLTCSLARPRLQGRPVGLAGN